MGETMLQASTVVGNSTDTRWSQVRSFRENASDFLYLAVDVLGAELMDLPMYGAEILDSAQEKYVEGPRTLEGLVAAVSDVASHTQDGLTVSLVAAAVHTDALYVAGVGSVSVLLVRDGVIHTLFQGSGTVSSVSGMLRDGDAFVVSTEEFVRPTREALIRAVQGDGPADEVLAPLIHNQADSSGMAGLVVSYSGDQSQEPRVVESGETPSRGSLAQSAISRVRGIVGSLTLRRPLTVRRERSPRRNTMISLVVLALLIVSVVYGGIRRSAIVRERRYSELEQSVRQQMEEVSSIADLNPERARYVLSQSRAQVDEYLSSIDDTSYQDRARGLLTLIDETERSALRKSDIAIEPFVDLSALSDESFDGFVLDEEGNVLLYDRSSGTAYGLSLSDKSSFSLGSFSSLVDLSYYNGRVYAASGDGVSARDVEGGDAEVVLESDEEWGEIAGIALYAGNIYLLDRGQGEVWKYPVLDDGYGARRRWFGAGIVLDLSNVVDMFVDGDIWLLTSTGKLERYSRGVPVDFSLAGYPGGERLSNPVAVFVGEDAAYVLERGERRVVVFTLEGEYVRQYVHDDLTAGKDVVVFEGEVYVLTDTQVISFGLE